MPDEPVYPPSATPRPPSSPPPPPPPAPPFQPVLPVGGVPGASAATTTGLTPNVAAGLAVMFSFISGVIFLAVEKRSAYVRFWAMQSVVVGVALFLFNVATWIFGFIFAHIPVLGWIAGILLGLFGLVVSMGAFILYVIMLIKAFSGEEWNVPVLGKIAREQLARFPA